MTNIWSDGGMLSKITATVVSSLLIFMVLFSMKLYAGQQDRFTGTEAKDMRSEILDYVDNRYTRAELSIIQYEAILRRLDRIEAKLDTHLKEH